MRSKLTCLVHFFFSNYHVLKEEKPLLLYFVQLLFILVSLYDDLVSLFNFLKTFRPQSTKIKKIVEKIINILDFKSSCVSKDLVGMDSPIQELEKLLLLDSDDDVRAIGIRGMGGIGKTTLAMVLYNKISHLFGACCFIDYVSKIYRLHDGPLGVQKQILHQTLCQEPHQICNLYQASNLIRRRLCRQRVLMIFDNVDKVEQLEKIGVCRERLGGGSRIIIISRNEHIFKVYGVDEVVG